MPFKLKCKYDHHKSYLVYLYGVAYTFMHYLGLSRDSSASANGIQCVQGSE